MNERIKEVRKTLKLTQSQFAEKLNLSKDLIWAMEKGARKVSDRTIRDINQIFKVNTTWLRTGEGEMFDTTTEEQEIAELLTALRSSELDPFIRRMVAYLVHMDHTQLEAIKSFMGTIIEEKSKE